MTKRMVAVGAGLAALLAIPGAACGGDDEARFEGTWVLTSGTADGAAVPIVEGYRITLTLEGSHVGGTAACNLYGGEAEIDGDEIELGPFAVTERGCEPAVMTSEQAYLGALAAVERIAREDDVLVLTGPGVELRFDRVPPIPTAELIGTVWELDTLIEGEGASSVSGDPATLELRADGTLAGSTGCRTLSGTYQLSGDEVVATTLSADGACQPELERQDGHVVTVIGDGFTVEIGGDRLTLTSMGSQGLGYRAR